MPAAYIAVPIDSNNRHAYIHGMRTDEAVKHFGTQQALAKALGIAQSSVAGWGETPPAIRQLQLERITQGVLRANGDILEPKSKSQSAGVRP